MKEPPQLPSVNKTADKKKSNTQGYGQAGILNTQKNDYAERVATAAAKSRGEKHSANERMTGDNYTRLYQEREAAQRAQAQEKNKK